MEKWYQSPYNNRHPKLKQDTHVQTRTQIVSLPRGTVILPVRKEYLPRGTWVYDKHIDQEVELVAYTESHGYVIIPVSYVDFSK